MAIVRKDKMLAGYNGNLESVKVHDNAGTAPVQTTNGVFVVVEGLMAGEREVKKARLAGVADSTQEVLLVHNAEVMYDKSLNKLEDYVIEADQIARAYRLFDGDIITLTTDLFAEAVAVGDQLIVKTDGKLGKDATALPNAKFVFEVIEDCGYELHKTMKAYAVQVVRQK
jgi:hypothetical protein